MDHKESPSTTRCRKLVAELLRIGCSEKQVINMLLYLLEQLNKCVEPDSRVKQP